jgi:hypothetical protein
MQGAIHDAHTSLPVSSKAHVDLVALIGVIQLGGEGLSNVRKHTAGDELQDLLRSIGNNVLIMGIKNKDERKYQSSRARIAALS